MRKTYFLIALVLSAFTCASMARAEVTEQADLLAPIFVNCPESTKTTGHCDELKFTFKAVEPFTGMPSYWMRYRLVSGPGAIDSITGDWSYQPTGADTKLGEQTVEVAASLKNRTTTGPQNCRYRLVIKNSVTNLYLPKYTNPPMNEYRALIGRLTQIPFSLRDGDPCDTLSAFIKSVNPEFAGSLDLWWTNRTGSIEIYPATEDVGKRFNLEVGFTDQIDTNYGNIAIFVADTINQPPRMLNTDAPCPNTGVGFQTVELNDSHCRTFYYDFDACDPDDDYYVFQLISGPGQVDASSGTWFAMQLPVGDYEVKVIAIDPYGSAQPSDTALIIIHSRNLVPVIWGGCGTHIITNTGAIKNVQMTGYENDYCDSKQWSIESVVPSMGASASVDSSGIVSFMAYSGGNYIVTVGLSDGLVTEPVTCEIFFSVSSGSLYDLRIEMTEDTYQGQFESVDVTLRSINTDPVLGGLGGIDLLFGYDNSAISLQGVQIDSSDIYQICKWEYFTYRFGANGNCGDACPSGLVRVVGLAETNNGAAHPTCEPRYVPDLPATLFKLKYLITNDRTFECQVVPIRFFWIDCGDNTLSSWDGGQLYMSGSVFDSDDSLVVIDPALAQFPGYAGVPAGQCTNPDPNKPAPDRNISFHHGGVSIHCPWILDPTGDINLNGLAYELADCVMFHDYFLHGLSVFEHHEAGSMAASDVNKDSVPLTLADYTYMMRIYFGDALPIPPASSTNELHLLLSDNWPSVAVATIDEVGAMYLVFEGFVIPELLLSDATLEYTADSTQTRVLITTQYSQDSPHITSGRLLNGTAGHQILQADAVTPMGAKIPVVVDNMTSVEDTQQPLPRSFALRQNYPNPFNAGTVISFDLPRAAEVRLEILNVAGQLVHELSRHYVAGRHQIEWDGAVNGRPVASGVYYYRITAGEFTATKKMVLLK